MQRLHGLPAVWGPLFAVHVTREALLQMLFGPDAVDAVLRLAEARFALSTALLVAPNSLSSRNSNAFSSIGFFNLFSASPTS